MKENENEEIEEYTLITKQTSYTPLLRCAASVAKLRRKARNDAPKSSVVIAPRKRKGMLPKRDNSGISGIL